MDGFLKNFTFYILGAAVGSLVTVKAVKKYYSEIADEEIQSVKEHHGCANDILINKIVEPDKDYKKEETDFTGDAAIMSYKSTRQKSNYHKYFNGGDIPLDSKLHPEDDTPDIQHITEDIFNTDPHYEKMTVYYYTEIDTITDESDGENLIGDDGKIIDSYNSLLHLDVYTSDGEGPIYLRSNGLGIDFEVIKV